MAITLVTPSAPSTSNTALTGSALPATDGASIDFGNLLSLQISGLPTLAPPLGENKPQLNEQETGNLESGELLAGMLAVSPEIASAVTMALPSDPQSGLSIEIKDSPSLADTRLSALIPRNTESAATSTVTLSALTTEQSTAFAAKADPAAIIAAQTTSTTENARGEFAATLAAQAVNPSHIQRPHETVATTEIHVPIQDERWANSFSDRIVWMSKNDLQSAQLNINPPQLGPVQISLKLNGDQASAVFASPHAEVRQAIEDALPRLREVLAGAGIELGQTNVGAQMAQQERGNQAQTGDTLRFSGDKAILRDNTAQSGGIATTIVRSGRGMVDLFA